MVLNLLLPLVLLVLLHLPLQPPLLPALRARIRISMKARQSISEPSVLYPARFFALPMSTFNTMPMVIPNVTPLWQLLKTFAPTASLSPLLQQLYPVNLRARLAYAAAVTTTVTTVLGACKRTRPQGCSFRNTLPLQGCPRTDFRQFSNLLPRMTTNIPIFI